MLFRDPDRMDVVAVVDEAMGGILEKVAPANVDKAIEEFDGMPELRGLNDADHADRFVQMSRHPSVLKVAIDEQHALAKPIGAHQLLEALVADAVTRHPPPDAATHDRVQQMQRNSGLGLQTIRPDQSQPIRLSRGLVVTEPGSDRDHRNVAAAAQQQGGCQLE